MEADEVPYRVLPRSDFTRLSTIRERSSRSSSDDSDFKDLPLPPVPPRNLGSTQPKEDPKTASTEFLYSRMEDFDDEPAAVSREDLRAFDSDRSTSNTLQKSSWSSSCSVDEGILYLDAGGDEEEDDDDDDGERSSAYRDKSPILRSLSASPSRLLQQNTTQRRRRRVRRRRAGD